jgi:hypothetical protein
VQVSEDEIDVQAALVRLVDDQRVVAQQPPVVAHLGQQDAVGHELDQRVLAGRVGETDLVADNAARPGRRPAGTRRSAWLGPKFLGDAFRHGPGGESARLGVTDLAGHATAEFQADFWNLGGFARTCLPRDDHDLVVADRRGDLVPPLADRKLGRIADGRHGEPAGIESGRCRLDLGQDLAERLLP